MPDPLVVVAPRALPSVSAPLGWVLSEPSRIKLDAAIAAEAAARCGQHAQPALFCPLGVGRLGDLLALIGRA